MITVSTGIDDAKFHVAYHPAPLDVFYMRGCWLTWARVRIDTRFLL